jgi:8-hydroxy-5-deazaflavin:NADPH oxidoreductase
LAEDPQSAGDRRVLFFAGAQTPAKAEVAGLIDQLGFAGVDLGQVS